MAICLFCASPIKQLRRAVSRRNNLLNTEDLGGVLRRALSSASLSGAPMEEECLLCPLTPKIVR